MTRRERMERRLEKRTAWADKREASAGAALEQASLMDAAIPFGRPILVGHHRERRDRNYRARIEATTARGVRDSKMAEHHSARARGIARQLDKSVFSDDADAIEQLRARIVEREGRRDRIKAFNRSCRKGAPDPALLSEHERDELATLRRVAPFQFGKDGAFPGYVLTNLGAAIRKDSDRITEVQRRVRRSERAREGGGVDVSATGDFCAVTFAEKPERAILDSLKAAGFRWSGGSWHGALDALPSNLRSYSKEEAR